MNQISNDEFTSKLQYLRKVIITYFGQDPKIIRKMPITLVIEKANPLALVTAEREGFTVIDTSIVISIESFEDMEIAAQNIALLNQSLAEVATIQKTPKKVQKQAQSLKKEPKPKKMAIPKKSHPKIEKEKMRRELVSKEVLSRDTIYNFNSYVGSCAMFWLILSLAFGLAQEALFSSLDEKYPVDLWSISHIAAGIWISYGLFFLKGDKFNPGTLAIFAFVVLLVFEIGEWGFASLIPNLFQEIFLNRIVDLIVNGMGCAYAYRKLSKLTTTI